MKFSLLTLLPFVAASTLKESRDTHPAAWEKIGSPTQDQKVHLTLFLSASDQAVSSLEREFLDRSNPTSSKFGQWMSNDDVHALVAPTTDSVSAVMSYFSSRGALAVARTSNSDVITVDLTVEEVEEILEAEYDSFVHKDTESVVHRTMSYR